MLPQFQNRRSGVVNPAGSARLRTNTPNNTTNTPSPQIHPVHGFSTPLFQQAFQQHQHQHQPQAFPPAMTPMPPLVIPSAGFPMFHQPAKPMSMTGPETTGPLPAGTAVGMPFSDPYHRNFSSPMPRSDAGSATPMAGMPGAAYAVAPMRVGSALSNFYAQQQANVAENPWEYGGMGYSTGFANGHMYGDSAILASRAANLSTMSLGGLDNVGRQNHASTGSGRSGWGRTMLPVHPFTPLEAVPRPQGQKGQKGQPQNQGQAYSQSQNQTHSQPKTQTQNGQNHHAVLSADSDTQNAQYTETLAHTVANAGVDDYDDDDDDENEDHRQKQRGQSQLSAKGKLPAQNPTTGPANTPAIQSLLLDRLKCMSLMDLSAVSSDMDVSTYSLGPSSPVYGHGHGHSHSHAHNHSAMDTSAATSALDLTMNTSTYDTAPDAPTSKTPKPVSSAARAPSYPAELPPTPLRVFTAAQKSVHGRASPTLSHATTTATVSPRTALVLHPQPQRPVSASKARAMASSFWRASSATAPDSTQTTAYRPMHAVSCAARPPPKALPEPSTEPSTALVTTNMAFSDNYRGERTLRNCSAAIDDSQNCSLWITNLPPGVTHRELLRAIRGIGRVYATVINPPNAASGHTTSAAKIVFFERDAAHAFFVWANHTGFWLRGFQARVSWNRIKSCEQTNSRNKSRVLELTGFSDMVNEAFLSEWFSRRFKFEVDEVVCLLDTGVWAKIEFRFGSYRCQAEAAKMAIARELSQYIWEVRFGVDPCSVADEAVMVPQRALADKEEKEEAEQEADEGRE